MQYLVGVPYLELSDFNSDISLKNYIGKGKPVVIMVQGNYCGFCTQAKPAFLDFAKSNDNIVGATIQVDSEKDLGELISILDSNGYPAYLGFDSSGQYVKTHSGERDKSSLEAFANSLF